MTPSLTAEQQEFRDSFRSFLAEHASFAVVRKRFESLESPDSTLWNKLMELGVLSYFSENSTSGGGTVRDLGLLAAEAGYALMPENLIDAALVAHLVSVRCAEEDRELLQAEFGSSVFADMASGACRVAITQPRADFTAIRTPKGKTGKASGTARFVAAPHNPAFLFATHGSETFVCDLRSPATAAEIGSLEDSLDRTQRRYRMVLKDVPSVRLASVKGENISLIQRALLAFELSGISRKALDLTVEYVKIREQFDVPVGGFQAVQHAAADMLVRVEALAALSDFACWSSDASPDQLKLAALSASLFGSDEAPKVVEKAIQLHGGIGFTWEHDLHLLLRRARTIAALLAPQAQTHRDLIAAAGQS